MTEPELCSECGDQIDGAGRCRCQMTYPPPRPIRPGMVVNVDDPVATVEFEASVKLYALLKDIQIDLKRVADALDRAQPKGSPKL